LGSSKSIPCLISYDFPFNPFCSAIFENLGGEKNSATAILNGIYFAERSAEQTNIRILFSLELPYAYILRYPLLVYTPLGYHSQHPRFSCPGGHSEMTLLCWDSPGCQ
jgi:hypothetical protein